MPSALDQIMRYDDLATEGETDREAYLIPVLVCVYILRVGKTACNARVFKSNQSCVVVWRNCISEFRCLFSAPAQRSRRLSRVGRQETTCSGV